MSRELNSDFFPESTSKSALNSTLKESSFVAPSFHEEDFKLLVSQIDFLKKKFKDQENRYETLNTRLTDFTSAIKSKFERLTGVSQRLEEMTKLSLQDLGHKYTQLFSKVNERKVSDAKIQELVDRHNQLIQSFEVRMNQSQKFIAEQEMQLMSLRSELKEAQREMARLKKI